MDKHFFLAWYYNVKGYCLLTVTKCTIMIQNGKKEDLIKNKKLKKVWGRSGETDTKQSLKQLRSDFKSWPSTTKDQYLEFHHPCQINPQNVIQIEPVRLLSGCLSSNLTTWAWSQNPYSRREAKEMKSMDVTPRIQELPSLSTKLHSEPTWVHSAVINTNYILSADNIDSVSYGIPYFPMSTVMYPESMPSILPKYEP